MTKICDFPYPIYDQNGGKMAKIDTLFMTKTAEKPYTLWGRTYLYSPYKVVTPRALQLPMKWFCIFNSFLDRDNLSESLLSLWKKWNYRSQKIQQRYDNNFWPFSSIFSGVQDSWTSRPWWYMITWYIKSLKQYVPAGSKSVTKRDMFFIYIFLKNEKEFQSGF